MSTTLRRSQVEVLRAVHKCNAPDFDRADVLNVGGELNRGEHSAERSLIRLTEQGYLTRSPFVPSTYRLTQKGYRAIGGDDGG